MLHILLVPDGAADLPLPELNGLTPLQAANTPNLNALASHGSVGSVQVTPLEMYPGSDAANMALLGYNPSEFYTGRGPVEAAAMGIQLSPEDIAFRCSLITATDDTLLDYSAGHVSTEEARELVIAAQDALCTAQQTLYPGISYRHILKWQGGSANVTTHAPHENMGSNLVDIFPKGDKDEELIDFIRRSQVLLNDHPINERRRAAGLPVANTLWPWSPGRTPLIRQFEQVRGCSGALVAAVDVVKGLGQLAGLEVLNVPGATGYFDTDYSAKAQYALEAAKRHDFIWIHVEAPDEAGHAGSASEKVRAIEAIDREVVGPLITNLSGRSWRLLVVPDHMTPVSTRKHGYGPVPFLFFDSNTPPASSSCTFDESVHANPVVKVARGELLMDMLFS